MPGNTAFLTPYAKGEARIIGKRLFRKKLLPVGEIDYEGQRVRFDRDFLATLVDSFDANAYDQVPFQLANDKNQHTNDPERTRGEVRALDLQPDGLYMTVSTTDEGAKVISENPRLGVSARIVNGLRRADGKAFKAAIQHALGTLDPRINGLGPWEAIEASNTGGEPVIDLTDTEYREAGPAVAELTEAEVQALRALLADNPQSTEPEGDDGSELTDEQLAELIAQADALLAEDEPELTDDEIEAILAEAGVTDDDLSEGQPEVVTAAMDPATQHALELASAQLDVQHMELARVQAELAAGRFAQERELFMHEYGIPPSILDMARPLLEGDDHVVELSSGVQTDAGAVMRQVLTAIGQQVKLMDLSAELGSGLQDSAETSRRAETMDLVKNFRDVTGV